MRQKIFEKPEFERKLCHCSNVDEVRQLIKENPAVNTELVRRACADTISLIRSVFERLVLKDNKFVTHGPVKNDSVKKLFNAIKLDANLAENDNMTNLNDRPLLKAYLKHCTKERTYFFLLKNVANHHAQHVFPSDCLEIFLIVCIISQIRCQVPQTKGITSNSILVTAQTQQKTTCC